MTKKPSEKNKTWEKERRDRLNKSFEQLAKLLPQYDPSVTWSKNEIIQKSIEHIRKLHEKHENYLQSSDPEILSQYNELIESLKFFQSRNGQLSELLKKANITVPPLQLPKFVNDNPKLSEENNFNNINTKPVGRPKKYANKFSNNEVTSSGEVSANKNKTDNNEPNVDHIIESNVIDSDGISNVNNENKTNGIHGSQKIACQETCSVASTSISSVTTVCKTSEVNSNAIVTTGVLLPLVPYPSNVIASTLTPDSTLAPFPIFPPLVKVTNVSTGYSKCKILNVQTLKNAYKFAKDKDGKIKILPRPGVKLHFRRSDGKLPIPVLKHKIIPIKRKRKRRCKVKQARMKGNETDNSKTVGGQKRKNLNEETDKILTEEISKVPKINDTETPKEKEEVKEIKLLEKCVPTTTNGTNNYFSTLQIPQTESNKYAISKSQSAPFQKPRVRRSISPTAAFLLSFPVVSTCGGKSAEMSDEMLGNNLISSNERKDNNTESLENLNTFFTTKEYHRFCERNNKIMLNEKKEVSEKVIKSDQFEKSNPLNKINSIKDSDITETHINQPTSSNATTDNSINDNYLVNATTSLSKAKSITPTSYTNLIAKSGNSQTDSKHFSVSDRVVSLPNKRDKTDSLPSVLQNLSISTVNRPNDSNLISTSCLMTPICSIDSLSKNTIINSSTNSLSTCPSQMSSGITSNFETLSSNNFPISNTFIGTFTTDFPKITNIPSVVSSLEHSSKYGAVTNVRTTSTTLPFTSSLQNLEKNVQTSFSIASTTSRSVYTENTNVDLPPTIYSGACRPSYSNHSAKSTNTTSVISKHTNFNTSDFNNSRLPPLTVENPITVSTGNSYTKNSSVNNNIKLPTDSTSFVTKKKNIEPLPLIASTTTSYTQNVTSNSANLYNSNVFSNSSIADHNTHLTSISNSYIISQQFAPTISTNNMNIGPNRTPATLSVSGNTGMLYEKDVKLTATMAQDQHFTHSSTSSNFPSRSIACQVTSSSSFSNNYTMPNSSSLGAISKISYETISGQNSILNSKTTLSTATISSYTQSLPTTLVGSNSVKSSEQCSFKQTPICSSYNPSNQPSNSSISFNPNLLNPALDSKSKHFVVSSNSFGISNPSSISQSPPFIPSSVNNLNVSNTVRFNANEGTSVPQSLNRKSQIFTTSSLICTTSSSACVPPLESRTSNISHSQCAITTFANVNSYSSNTNAVFSSTKGYYYPLQTQYSSDSSSFTFNLTTNTTTSLVNSMTQNQTMIPYSSIKSEIPWIPPVTTDYKLPFTFSLTPSTTNYTHSNKAGSKPQAASVTFNTLPAVKPSESVSASIKNVNALEYSKSYNPHTISSLTNSSNNYASTNFTFSLTEPKSSIVSSSECEKPLIPIHQNSSSVSTKKFQTTYTPYNFDGGTNSYTKDSTNFTFALTKPTKSVTTQQSTNNSQTCANTFSIDSTLGVSTSYMNDSIKNLHLVPPSCGRHKTSNNTVITSNPTSSASINTNSNQHSYTYENKIQKSSHKNHVNWMTSSSSVPSSEFTYPTVDFVQSTSGYYPSQVPANLDFTPRKNETYFPHTTLADENFTAWSPSKVLDTSHLMPATTLSNYYTDLSFCASNYTGVNNIDSIKTINSKTYNNNNNNNNNEKIEKLSYKTTASNANQGNFFSVSQLVDQTSTNLKPYENCYKKTSNKNKESRKSSGDMKHLCTSDINQHQYSEQILYNEHSQQHQQKTTNSNNYSAEALISKKEKHRNYPVSCNLDFYNASIDANNSTYIPPEASDHGYNSNYFYNYMPNQNYGQESDYLGAYSGDGHYSRTAVNNEKTLTINTTKNDKKLLSSSSIQMPAPPLPPPSSVVHSSNLISYDSNYFPVPLTVNSPMIHAPPPPPPLSTSSSEIYDGHHYSHSNNNYQHPSWNTKNHSLPLYHHHHSHHHNGSHTNSETVGNQHQQQQQHSNQTGSGNLTNFNLSTICPEINEKVGPHENW